MKFPDLFTPAQNQVLDRVYTTDQEQRQSGSTDPLRLKALRPQVAQFVYTLAISRQAQRIAEFGTSAGYSTLHLAAAAARTGGRVHSLDREPQKTTWATQNLKEAGLEHYTDLFTGTCADFVAHLPANLDLVLLDFGPQYLLPHLAPLKKKMAPGAWLFADGGPDNMWETHPEFRAFKEDFDRDPVFTTFPLYLEKHQLLVVKMPEQIA
jgi:predicted O-methyltransferase YrrM